MSDYRRLISYIYEYEGKEKGKNVGFVKLEARSGQCRLNLSIKKVYVGGNAIGVYLLGKGGQETFLGNIFIRGGSGEFRATVDVRNVEGSGNGLDTYYGLSVHDVKNSWRSYTTIWEDAAAPEQQGEMPPAAGTASAAEKSSDATSPRLAGESSSFAGDQLSQSAQDVLPGASGELPPAVISSVVREIEAEIAREEERKEAAEPVIAHAAEVGGALAAQPDEPIDMAAQPSRSAAPFGEPCGVSEQPNKLSAPPTQSGENRASAPQAEPASSPARNVIEFPQRTIPERGPQPQPEPGSAAETSPSPQSAQAAGTVVQSPPSAVAPPQNPAPTARSGSQASPVVPPQKPAKEEQPAMSPELENPAVLRYLQETEDLAADPERLWQELRKSYPKIQPFDYEGECEILTIRPQDIGRLPRESWVYGNNSFLLHGYYNFRYLILIRLKNQNTKPRYLIGVPGHYYSNEKYMASMFGFPNFVLSKKQPPNDGRFGYWYTDMKLR